MSHHVHRRQQAESHALAQSQLDALTGLANRPALLDRLDLAIRADLGPSALLLLDVAGFRDVNDTFGVDVGDELLRAVAQRLAIAVRTQDMLARIGSDEFAIC